MMRPRNKKWLLLIPLVALPAILLFGWFVMLLWNAILVPAAGANAISLWQGLGLLVLSRILFGGFGGGRGRGWKDKWRNMSDDEKAKLKAEWKGRFRMAPDEPENG
jgi:Ca2+/H+ antiporter, TMEM165/GDT1 family